MWGCSLIRSNTIKLIVQHACVLLRAACIDSPFRRQVSQSSAAFPFVVAAAPPLTVAPPGPPPPSVHPAFPRLAPPHLYPRSAPRFLSAAAAAVARPPLWRGPAPLAVYPLPAPVRAGGGGQPPPRFLVRVPPVPATFRTSGK